jgi:hypothetical protein
VFDDVPCAHERRSHRSGAGAWFTYPPAGSPAQQAWIYAQDGSIEGDRIRFASAITTRGPRFGPGSTVAGIAASTSIVQVYRRAP